MQLYVPLMLPHNKSYPLRTLLFTLSFIFFYSLPFAFSQSYYAQTVKGCPDHHIRAAQLPGITNFRVDSSLYFLDNYRADSTLYAPGFMSAQGQLINSIYTYYGAHSDTTNSYKAKSMFYQNYDCINAISVAFDSIVNGKADTIALTQVNTIYIPIIQVNHSRLNDTIKIELTIVDSQGYPNKNNYLVYTLFIASLNNNYNIGAGNDYTVNTLVWNLNKPQLTGGRFAVNVTYYDSTKLDSCWFIYGYGSFTDTCRDQKNSLPIFAKTTHFSKIRNNTVPYFANSFALFNQYAGHGFLPDITGDNIFYPCDTTSPNNQTFHPGIDGVNYLQDIDIAAGVLFMSNLGVPNLTPTDISVTQNYPNPYNNTTVISYTLLKPADVSLKIIDLAGRQIFSESYSIANSGQHSITLNATDFSSGVYFYSITSSGYTITKKMVIY